MIHLAALSCMPVMAKKGFSIWQDELYKVRKQGFKRTYLAQNKLSNTI